MRPRGLKPVSAQSIMGFSCSSRDSPGVAANVFPDRLRATCRDRRGEGDTVTECQGDRSPPLPVHGAGLAPARQQLPDSCAGCAVATLAPSEIKQRKGTRSARRLVELQPGAWLIPWMGIRPPGLSVPARPRSAGKDPGVPGTSQSSAQDQCAWQLFPIPWGSQGRFRPACLETSQQKEAEAFLHVSVPVTPAQMGGNV